MTAYIGQLGWIGLILATLYTGQARSARPVPRASTPMTCYSCNGTTSLGQCGSVICPADMLCYMDELITEQLAIEYNGGCRARDVCMRGASGSSFGKRDGGLYACIKCCDAHDHCNSQLCGIRAQPTTTASSHTTQAPVGTGLLQCHQCNFLRHGSQGCSQYGTCHSNERCATIFHVVDKGVPYYELGCMLTDRCELNEKVARITNQHSPSQCCNSSLCNQNPYTPGFTVIPTTSTIAPRRHVTCLSCVNSTSHLPGCGLAQCDAATEECYVEMTGGVVNAGCRYKQRCQTAPMTGKRHQDATSGSARATSGCAACCDPDQQCLCNGLHCGLNNFAVLNLMNKANCLSG